MTQAKTKGKAKWCKPSHLKAKTKNKSNDTVIRSKAQNKQILEAYIQCIAQNPHSSRKKISKKAQRKIIQLWQIKNSYKILRLSNHKPIQP